ncbi:tyrosine-type recombinase/integrase [Stigmatella erecta]|uniref:Site-specific recombinase XerD n=1 Tax=Stigmatella erecta TaxID=83460 RepID=A0A1I0JA47_9BACT|nr:tyrosine-type recombinase/integrase [Stigmatella erecta]SEU06880.1 Site-specific recombinase XerD [Stigmatella erecta]
MPSDRSRRWDGGYITPAGVFVIYKRVCGKLYEVSTRATSSRAANEHLVRFQVSPEGYKPEGEAPRGALLLDQELGRAFLFWSRDEKGNTVKWVKDQQRALAWWEGRLSGVDLRTLKTSRILTELDGATGRKQLIATLKTFYAWLRTERHLITTAEDPTFGQVKVPQAQPKQLEKIKAIGREEYERALTALEGWPRDALEVLGGTGWHVTELERFAKTGDIEAHPLSGAPVLVCPQTKGGAPLRTQVSPAVAAAAKRLRDRGGVDYFRFRDALKGVGATFNPGFLRHSVATWAINAGADPASVAAFLGHKSSATTKRFYATHAVPAKVPTLADMEPKQKAESAA